MNEHFKQDQNVQDADLDMVGILRKMQQQLNFLEIKIDKLIESSGGGRPSFGKDRRFGKPFRPGGGGGGGFRRDRGDRPQFGGDRQGGGGFRREGRNDGPREFSPERSFDRPREGGKSHGPERGRKAFFKRTQSKSRGQFPHK